MDTAGQELSHAVMIIYFWGAIGARFVYDVTSSDSFASIGRQLSDIREDADPLLALILINDKTDREELRAVSSEEGKSLAEPEFLLFIGISAKDATNITKAFKPLNAKVIQRLQKRRFV
jgi:GTPase SAR1 family protein